MGRVSARVREELWKRICETVRSGQATMVYPASGEQKMEFRVHNTTWEVVDYDGIKLMRRPLPRNMQETSENGYDMDRVSSKAAMYQRSRRIQGARQRAGQKMDYTVLSLETTGISHLRDHIIEAAALRVRDGCITEKLHMLVQCPVPLASAVEELMGLSGAQLTAEGKPLCDVLTACRAFIGADLLVVHHAALSYGFFQAACKKAGLPVPRNACIDTMQLARQKLNGLDSYSLEDVSARLGLDATGCRRAQKDCELIFGIYQKLKEI